MAQIQSQEGAEEQMGRNGGAQETQLLTKSTASDTCTEAALVQESLWKPEIQMQLFLKHLINHLLGSYQNRRASSLSHPSSLVLH